MGKFVPKRVFFEPKALEYPLGEAIYKRLQQMNVDLQMISGKRVTGIPGETAFAAYRAAKETLVVGVRKIGDFATCKPSAHYQLPLATSCPGMCEYCYLATNLGKKPYLRIYVNIDEILEKAKEYMDARSPEITVFEGAATSDPIPIEYFTGLLAYTIGFFGKQSAGRFRFVTKHVDVDSLLQVEHQGHTRFRFSINAQSIIKKYEHRTPAMEERVAAARKVAQAGYALGFIIAPVFYYPGWQADYAMLFQELDKRLPADRREQLTFEIITHRFTKRAKSNILALYPSTTLPMEEAQRQYKFGQFGYGKYIYAKQEMEEMKDFFNKNLNTYFPGAKIEYFV